MKIPTVIYRPVCAALPLIAAGIMLGTGWTTAATPPSDKGDKVVTGGDLAFMNDAAAWPRWRWGVLRCNGPRTPT